MERVRLCLERKLLYKKILYLLLVLGILALSGSLYYAMWSSVPSTIMLKADMDQEQRASIKDTLADIRLKNQNTGYQSVEELRGDIEILETILHNGAHPAVLTKNMAESGIFDLPDDFDEELLCEVCEAE